MRWLELRRRGEGCGEPRRPHGASTNGDMRELGLELWSLRRREVPEGVQVHPALNRIAVQKVAATEVKALVEARRGLIAQL